MTMTYGASAGRAWGEGGSRELPEGAWSSVATTLKAELGEAAFGSWLGGAEVREVGNGAMALVTATTTARDWVGRNAWRRIGGLWAKADPLHRPLRLMARAEYEREAGAQPPAAETKADDSPASEAPAPREPTGQPRSGGRPPRGTNLQERYTFDTFVVGPANDFAFEVAKRVAAWGDPFFNPIVVHGPWGFGKTHLLNAIAWEAQRRAPNKKVVYLTAEDFLSDFVRAMRDRSGAAFKDDLRTADLLLVDDAQFVCGKVQCQAELLHTLAALAQDGRRVVLTSDRAPNALAEMDPRLRGHLQSGLVCGIEPADKALRLGILERKLSLLSHEPGMGSLAARTEVLDFLADRFSDSVRELEGALNTLVARAGAGLARFASTTRRPSCVRIFAGAKSGSPSTRSRRPSPSTMASSRLTSCPSGATGRSRGPGRRECGWPSSSPPVRCPTSAAASAAATTPRCCMRCGGSRPCASTIPNSRATSRC